jgi:hypothetical protein
VRCITTLLFVTAACGQAPTVRVSDTAGLRAALAAAVPGTTIAVAAGEYSGFSANGVSGSAGRPITVRGERSDDPPRFTNGVHLVDAVHVVLQDLLIAGAPGNGLNIDDGGDFATPSHHVVLRKLTVRDTGGTANHDGIKLSGVTDFEVAECTIERWGRSGSAIDMVGCHRGLVVGCTIRDREQDTAANGVQMKGGTRDVTVRRCRFEHAGQRAVQLGGSTGRPYFRPAAAGFEAKDLLVEGNTILGSLAPFAFVGCDGATVRCNTVYLPGKWVLRILQETRAEDFVPCRNGVFTDNLVVVRGRDPEVNVGPDTAPATFTFARNWWYRADAPGRSRPKLPSDEQQPAGGGDPLFVDAAGGDLRLRQGSPARAHGADALADAPATKR